MWVLWLCIFQQDPSAHWDLPVEGLFPVPLVDLSHLEKPVQEQLDQVKLSIVDFKLEGDKTLNELGQAFGTAGGYFQAYELNATALACYKNAILLQPARFEWVYLMACVYRQEGLNELALHYFQEAGLLLRQDYPALLVQMGQMFFLENKLDLAKSAFEKALTLNPQSAASHAGLGEIALQNEQWQSALEHYQTALSLVPQANRLNYGLGLAYRGLGQMDEAKKYLALAGKVGIREPDPLLDSIETLKVSVSNYLAEGKKAFAAGRFQDAAAQFSALLQLDGANAEGWLNLGAAFSEMGNYESALQAFSRAESLNPDLQTLPYNRGLTALRRGDVVLAESQFAIAWGRNPKDELAGLYLAQSKIQLQKPTEAEAIYRQLLTDLKSASAALGLINLLLDQNRLPEVARCIQSLPNELILGYFPLAHTCGRFLAAVPDRTLRDGSRALLLLVDQADSENYEVHQTLAMVQAELGNCEQALMEQERAIELAQKAGSADLVDQLKRGLAHFAQSPCRP
ncbi:MAG: tetratricopeptide repeat protein [Acidobacteria bacterium]|nr:tetratricopeptide repeat protein [Acidobacteriota bacterium]MCB9398416.1 tetratricopeptide repeat protein [Acidobacteriota bacterium]